jgi:hypothetical protein
MLAPGDFGFAGSVGDSRAGFASPGLSALTGALVRLLEASDGVADAVTRHDRSALIRANEEADALVERVNALSAALTLEERAVVSQTGIPSLIQGLADAGRRNAFLIEQAWAVDAALMRLLIGSGRASTDGPIAAYGSTPGPAYVDRGA